MKLLLGKNSTNNMLSIFIKDSTQTYDKGLAGLDITKVNAYYYKSGEYHDHRINLCVSEIGQYISGGFVEIDAENMPGLYQLQIPDEVVADDSATLADNSVYLIVKDSGANNVVPCFFEIQLTENSLDDPWDANVVEINGTPASTTETVDANVVEVNGTTASTTTAQLGVNVVSFTNDAITAASIADDALINANVTHWTDFDALVGSDGLPLVAANNLSDIHVTATASSDVTSIDGSAAAATNLKTAVTGGSYNVGGGGIVAASVTGNVGGNVTGSVGSVAGNVTGSVGSVAGNVTGSVGSVAGNVTGSVGSVAGNVTGSVASVTNTVNATLVATALDGITIETGVTAKQALAIIAAALAGQLSGAATTDVTIKAANNAGTTRIEATVDADGNRSAVTLTLP